MQQYTDNWADMNRSDPDNGKLHMVRTVHNLLFSFQRNTSNPILSIKPNADTHFLLFIYIMEELCDSINNYIK